LVRGAEQWHMPNRVRVLTIPDTDGAKLERRARVRERRLELRSDVNELVPVGRSAVVLRLAGRLGTDVTPRHAQVARVTMSRMPRCNRILHGGLGSPPDDTSMERLLAGGMRSSSG
jgi:hypothetical protein